MVRLRSAVEYRHRPTSAILSEPDPQGQWEPIDYKLLDAYLTMNREICTICNNPIWLCHSTDNRIEFTPTVRTCYAKAEIEDFEKTSKGKELGSGEYIIARPEGLDDGRGNKEPLPSRHEAYQKLP